MHLCSIPADKIHAVEIPTGLPLIYDFKQRKIRLLQEQYELETTSSNDSSGSGVNRGATASELLAKYNFGDSPELLFNVNKNTEEEESGCGLTNKDGIIIKLPKPL